MELDRNILREYSHVLYRNDILGSLQMSIFRSGDFDVLNGTTLYANNVITPESPAGVIEATELDLTNTFSVIKLGGDRWISGYNNNFFAGVNAGNLTLTGYYNAGIGYSALQNVTNGRENTGLGSFSLSNLTNGIFNVAAGGRTLQTATTASGNIALGYQSLMSVTSGGSNVSIGTNAGLTMTTGIANTIVGDNAGTSVFSSTGNTIVGAFCGNSVVTGAGNIMIGYNTGNTAGSGNTSCIYIGNPGATENTTIRIGDVTTQNACHVAGIHGRTSPSGIAVYVNTDGKLGTSTSSIRFKDEIATITKEQSDFVRQLRPVAFRYKETPEIQSYGLIAEEVLPLKPELVLLEEDGETPFTVKYDYVLPFLLSQLKASLDEIDGLKTRLSALEQV